MIELIVVIVILGILAATALPKFVDLRSDAVKSATEGVAAQLGSAMSINYAGCMSQNNAVVLNKCVMINNCNLGSSLLAGGLPSVAYTITSSAIASPAGTVNTACTVSNSTTTPATTATFTGIAAGF